jgi:hypothetical protein
VFRHCLTGQLIRTSLETVKIASALPRSIVNTMERHRCQRADKALARCRAGEELS